MNTLQRQWVRLVQLGFYLLYHQLAPIYDEISWIVSFGHWRKWQMAATSFVKGPNILELAHGPGHMLLTLHEAGYRVTGIDLSPQMGHLALNNIRQAGTRLLVSQASAQKLPFASDRFDTVLATFPTEFIADPNTLKEARRVLRKDGRLVVVPQARLTGGSPAVRLLEGLYHVTGQRPIPEGDSADNFANSLIQPVFERFRQAGFDIRVERVQQAQSEVIVLVATKHDEVT